LRQNRNPPPTARAIAASNQGRSENVFSGASVPVVSTASVGNSGVDAGVAATAGGKLVACCSCCARAGAARDGEGTGRSGVTLAFAVSLRLASGRGIARWAVARSALTEAVLAGVAGAETGAGASADRVTLPERLKF
jgi:hypothetical protein